MTTLPACALKYPAYYAPDERGVSKDSLASRVFFAALPFIALHKPFGWGITIALDVVHSYSSLKECINAPNGKQLFKTAIVIASLAGTIFCHPLGLCIGSLYDLAGDLRVMIEQCQRGAYQEAAYTSLSLAQHLFYLGTMVVGSWEVIAISMILNMVIEGFRSQEEFSKDHYIEGVAHIFMAAVRFCQAMPYVEKVATQRDFRSKNFVRSLNETIAKIRDQTAFCFYGVARFFVDPLWKMTDMWIKEAALEKEMRNKTGQKVSSVAKRVFSTFSYLPSALVALGGLFVAQIFHFSAFLLQTTPYIHLKGNIEVKKTADKTVSVFQLNCCLTAGGFSRLYGGLILSNEQRVEKIAEKINDKGSDLVLLQEVSDFKDGVSLCSKLIDTYAELYFHMGAKPFVIQNTSGLLVASKIAIENPYLQSFSDIPGTERMVNKSFFSFSTRAGNFITTHLSPSTDDEHPTEAEIVTREEEQKRVYAEVLRRVKENHRPVFVVGDRNIPWNSAEYKKSLLFQRGSDVYNQGGEEVTDAAATAQTDYLIQRNWFFDTKAKPKPSIIDYFISFFMPTENQVVTQKVPTFAVDRPKEAISDHAALLTNIVFKTV